MFIRPTKTRMLTHAERRSLWTALPQQQNPAQLTALIRLLLGTGLRISEALSLNVANVTDGVRVFNAVQLDARRSKGGYGGRIVSLAAKNDRLRTALLIHLQSLRSGGELDLEQPLFQSCRGRRLDRTAAFRQWKNLLRRAALADTPLHALRHTYLSLVAAASKDPGLVADVAGHSDPRTTARYIHRRVDELHLINQSLAL